jgi:prevent-host-death family protein
MRFVTVSELKQRATQIVSEIESTGEEVVVTKNGRPVVLVRLVDEKEFALAPRKKEEATHGKR